MDDPEVIKSIWNQFDEIRNIEIESSAADVMRHKQKGAIIRTWTDELLTSAPDNHVCSSVCVEQGTIERIDRINGIYGCRTGKITHICYADPANCRLMEYNADGEAICIFSGLVLFPGAVAEEYGRGVRGITMDLTGEASLEEIEIGKLLNNGTGGKEYCLNWSDTVFRSHENFQEIKSPDKNGTRKYVLKDRTLMNLSEIRYITMDLLFNKMERNRINSKYRQTREKKVRDAYRQYLKQMKKRHLAPTKHRIITIISEYLPDTSHLKLLELDKGRIEFLQNFILNLWISIKRTPYFMSNESKFHIKQHTLGMLYMLTGPLVVTDDNGYTDVLLEADDFLKENLPHQSELKEWNSMNHKTRHKYTKKDVTAGINNFKAAIHSSTVNKGGVFQAIRTAPRRRLVIF